MYEIPSIEEVMIETEEVITTSGEESDISEKVPRPNTETGWGSVT